MATILCEWGMAGVETLHAHVAALVIVDVLSFSTAVDVAASRGAIVYPSAFSEAQAAQLIADRVGAVVARPRHQAEGKFSLSPANLTPIPSETKLMLSSLMGVATLWPPGEPRGDPCSNWLARLGPVFS